MENNFNTNVEHEVFVEKKPLMPIHEKFIKMFISPNEVFENLVDHPKMFAPVLIAFVLAIIVAIIQIPFTQMAAESVNKVYEQMGIMMPQTDASNNLTTIITIAVMPLSVLFGWALNSVLYWITSRIFGIKVTLKNVFAVVAHVFLVQYLLLIPVMAVNSYLIKSGIDSFSLAVFLPGLSATNFMYYFAQGISLVAIWTIILTGMGIAKLGNNKAIKGILAVGIIYLISIAASSYMPILSLNMLKSLY